MLFARCLCVRTSCRATLGVQTPPPSPILGPPGTSALEFVCRLQYELSWTQFPELVRFSVVTKSEGKTHLVLTFTVRVYI